MAAARTIAFFDILTDQQNPQDCINMHDTIANWSTFLLSKSQQDEYRVLSGNPNFLLNKKMIIYVAYNAK